jgi:hypothetical protein
MLEGEEKGLHSIFITSTMVLIVTLMLLFMIMLSPSLSPVASIGDWDDDGHANSTDAFPRDASEWIDTDSDGIGDNGDAFPDDENETRDSDGDGVGDAADFLDSGDGGIRISLTSFVFKGYEDNYYRWRYVPNPWFKICVDSDGNGTYDVICPSPILNGSISLTDFFDVVVDIPEDESTITFTIIAYDVWEVSNNVVTDFEIMDYSPIEGTTSTIHTLDLPTSGNWSSSGLGDGDTPDCELAYSIETITLGS